MGTLISYAANEGAIRGVGIFILEVPAPGVVQAQAQNTVGFVGEFPWGPEALFEPSSADEMLHEMFGPCGQGHPAYQSLYGKRFGRVVCSRVLGSDAAAASVTIDDADTAGTASLVATARRKGAAGNGIELVIAATADVATSRDATIRFTRANGTVYERTYPAVQASDGTVTDPGDPFVELAAHASAEEPAHAGTYQLGMTPDGAASASTAGTDGTIDAAAYTAALARLAGVGSPADIVCPVGSSSAISVGDVNGALHVFAGDEPDKMILLRTTPEETVSAALSDAASHRGPNVVKLYGRVKQRLPTAEGDLEVQLTDGAPFLASILAQTDAWVSPGSREATRHTRQVVGVEHTTLSNEAYAILVEGGVSAWFMSTRNGAMIRGAVSTTLDEPLNRIRAQRYKIYVGKSLATFLEDYVDSPLDINLVTQVLGPNTTGQIGAIRDFLARERSAAHLVAFEIDPFSEMDLAKFAKGRWDIVVRVQDVPGAEQTVIRHQQGPSVVIDG